MAQTAIVRLGNIPMTRLVGVMGVFGVLLTLLVAGGLSWREYRQVLQDASSRAESTAFFLSDHARRLFEVADLALASLEAAASDRDWDGVAQDQVLQQRLRTMADLLPYVVDFWLYDAQGNLRLTSRTWPTPVDNNAGRAIFRAARDADGDMVIGETMVGQVSGRLTFLIARALHDAGGGFHGIIIASAELAYFQNFWRGLGLPPQTRVSLLRGESRTILAQSAAEAAPIASGPFVPMVDAIRREQPLRGVPLVLVVETSRNAVLEAWYGWLRAYTTLASLAVFALVWLTMLAFRQGRREEAAYAAIRDARQQLAEANLGLERTVADRTAELRETSQEVQRFAYLVGHDLRAPLVNVLGFTGEIEMLGREMMEARRVPLPDTRWQEMEQDFAEAIGFIRAGTSKMDRLLNHILRLSREGRRILRPEPVDVSVLLRSLADAVQFQASDGGGTIEVGVLPPLVADRLALEQVFGNLLDNAVKYLDPGRPGRIAVTGELAGPVAHFMVRDNGRGIPASDHTRIFELFRRSGPQDQPGEGIGLAYVKTLVRALGGGIAVASEPGVGSVFTVTLPVAPDPT